MQQQTDKPCYLYCWYLHDIPVYAGISIRPTRRKWEESRDFSWVTDAHEFVILASGSESDMNDIENQIILSDTHVSLGGYNKRTIISYCNRPVVPCSHGVIRSTCLACKRDYDLKYRRSRGAQPRTRQTVEERAATRQRYYERNKDSINAKRDARIALDRDAHNAGCLRRRDLNKDDVNAAGRARYNLNKDAINAESRRRRELNKDAINAECRRRYALNK